MNEQQAEAIRDLAHAVRNIGIYPPGVAGSTDGNGNYVASLTEAVLSVSKSLQNIANSIDRLADTVNDKL